MKLTSKARNVSFFSVVNMIADLTCAANKLWWCCSSKRYQACPWDETVDLKFMPCPTISNFTSNTTNVLKLYTIIVCSQHSVTRRDSVPWHDETNSTKWGCWTLFAW